MAKQIARLLKTDIMADLDLPGLAQLLESKGRKGDTMLAHITPQEAALLKARGGAGTMNPDTGLPEFYRGDFQLTDFADIDTPNIRTGGYATRAQPELSYGFDSLPTPEFEISSRMPSAFDKASTDQLAAAYMRSLPPDQQNLQTAAPMETASMDRLSMPAGAVSPVMPSGAPFYDIRSGGLRSSGSPEAINASIQAALASQYGGELPSALGGAPRAETPSVLSDLGKTVKQTITDKDVLKKLGLAGLAALPAIYMTRQAGKQGERARRELEAMASPYRTRGAKLIQQAESGELTPQEQQQLQAMQARAAQGAASRGGVGAEQAVAQTEAFRQQLLANKYDLGLKVANIGDQIAAGAIRTGLEADRYVSELTGNYFSNIAAVMGGMPGQQPGQQVPRS